MAENYSSFSIEHQQYLVERINALLVISKSEWRDSDLLKSDVTFEVDSKQFYAHRLILAAQSIYFRLLLLNNDFCESDNVVIPLPGKQSRPFGLLLSYMYSGRLLSLEEIELEDIVCLVEMAHEWQLERLFCSLIDYLATLLDKGNIFYLYFDVALIFDADRLIKACLDCIHLNADELAASDQWLELESPCLARLVSLDEFSLRGGEWQLLISVLNWINYNGDVVKVEEKRRILQNIRFDLIEPSSLNKAAFSEAKMVFDTLRDCDIDLNTLPSAKRRREPAHKREIVENVATHWSGAKLLRDGNVRNRKSLLGGKFNCLADRMNPNPMIHAFHPLIPNNDIHGNCFIIVKLKKISRVSSMLIDLPHIVDSRKRMITWSYRVETSIDSYEWDFLFEHQVSTGSQLLKFRRRKVKYVKITGYGSSNRHQDSFVVLNFECPASNFNFENENDFNSKVTLKQLDVKESKVSRSGMKDFSPKKLLRNFLTCSR